MKIHTTFAVTTIALSVVLLALFVVPLSLKVSVSPSVASAAVCSPVANYNVSSTNNSCPNSVFTIGSYDAQTGAFTGTGYCNTPPNQPTTWPATGTITGNTIVLHGSEGGVYTATWNGTISSDGNISGSWTDSNHQTGSLTATRTTTCQSATVTCSTSSQCGSNGFTGNPTCQGNSVFQTFRTWTCNNPGTSNSSCTPNDSNQLQQTCSGNQTCSGGTCVNQNITCNANSDCGTRSTIGSPYCQGASVYQNFSNPTCVNPGTANSSCNNFPSQELQATCNQNQTCSSGSCTNNTANLVVACTANPNPANTNQSVTFTSSVSGGTGSYTYQWSAGCSGFSQNCSNTFSNSGNYITFLHVVSGNQVQDASCSVGVNQACTPNTTQRCVGNAVYNFDSCNVQGSLVTNCTGNQTCSNGACLPVTCSTNSQCGTNGLTGSPTCNGNSVYQNFRTYTCQNPGTASSTCTFSDNSQFQFGCSTNQTCSAGMCVTNQVVLSQCQDGIDNDNDGAIDFPNDFSCGSATDTDETNPKAQCQDGVDNDSDGLIDFPQDTGCVSKQDNNEFTAAVVCSTNAQCGTDGYTGSATCQSGNVFQNFRTWTCNNPGQANSSCSSADNNQLKTTCGQNQACSNGSCSTNPTLTASCAASPNPATTSQSVTFTPTVAGGTGSYTYSWAGSCSGFGQTCSATLQNPNTHTVFLNVTSGTQVVSTSCNVVVNQACTPNSTQKCVGNAVYNFDSCNVQGSLVQTCNTNQTCSGGSCTAVACSTNSQCGSNGLNGSPTCNGNSVYQNFRTWTCQNPGTASSSCTFSDNSQFQFGCNGSQTCSSGTCITTNTCTNHSTQRCSGNSVYWYDSCGNQQDLAQTCFGGQTCSGNTCIGTTNTCSTHNYQQCSSGSVHWFNSCGQDEGISQACTGNQTCSGNTCINQVINTNTCIANSTQRCVGNSVYWFNSCGVQQSFIQMCSTNQTCSGNTCINNTVTTQAQKSLVVMARNLSSGNLNWSPSVAASPSDVVQFSIAVTSSASQPIYNLSVTDTLPANLIYNNNVTLDGVTNSGNVISGMNFDVLSSGQTRTITYQAQVAGPQNFSFGTTTLTDAVVVGDPILGSASIVVTKTGVFGATTISTGLTNNFLVDSFFIPLLIALIGIWLYRAGHIGVPEWVGTRQIKNKEARAQNKLQSMIAKIRQKEAS